MTTTRKRRWTLAIVAMMVVLGVVGFFVLREARKNVPRLVVLRQEQANGQNMVVFRFDAPKRKRAALFWMVTQSESTKGERKPVWGKGGTALGIVEAGQSKEFSVMRPSDGVWRLRCGVACDNTGVADALARLKSCFGQRSLRPLRSGTFRSLGSTVTIGSDLITNPVPPTADAPTK